MSLKKHILQLENFDIEKLRSSTGEVKRGQFKTLEEVKQVGISTFSEDIFNKLKNLEYDNTTFSFIVRDVMMMYIDTDNTNKNKVSDTLFKYIIDIQSDVKDITDQKGDDLSVNDILSNMDDKNKKSLYKTLGDIGIFDINEINSLQKVDDIIEENGFKIDHNFYLNFFKDEIIQTFPKYILSSIDIQDMFNYMKENKEIIDGKDCIFASRLMTLDDISSLDNNVGIFWTWHKESAKLHGDASSPYLYKLKGYMPVESIDWSYTIISRYWEYQDEYEVRGIEDSIVYINKIILEQTLDYTKPLDDIQKKIGSVFFDDKKYDNPKYDSIMTKKLNRVAHDNDGVIPLKRYAKFKM